MKWESEPNVFTKVLMSNTKLTKTLGDLWKLLDCVVFDDAKEAGLFMNELKRYIGERISIKTK